MAEHSTIEWTDATWNPITGCTLVSEGCRHCYAAGLAATRLKHHPSRAGLARINAAGEAKFTGEVRFNEQWIDQPLRWRRPRMIFVCAHGDLFHESVPDDWIDRVFAVMAVASHHTFQVLTKRPERARDYLGTRAGDWQLHWPDAARKSGALLGDMPALRSRAAQFPLPNVWLGTSVEDQATADARIPHLLAAPAAVRFLSAEPLLGPVDLQRIPAGTQGERLDWVIVGGESGAHARPMHPDWARSLRDQCACSGVAFFFKQWGAWGPDDGPPSGVDRVMEGRDACAWWNGTGWTIEENGYAVDLDAARGSGEWVYRHGKKRAGRVLDGRTWDEMPGGRSA